MRHPRRHRYPNLAAYLLATGDSQTDIAEAVGASQAQISRLVRGRTTPRPALARRLADHCRIPVESFYVQYVPR